MTVVVVSGRYSHLVMHFAAADVTVLTAGESFYSAEYIDHVEARDARAIDGSIRQTVGECALEFTAPFPAWMGGRRQRPAWDPPVTKARAMIQPLPRRPNIRLDCWRRGLRGCTRTKES